MKRKTSLPTTYHLPPTTRSGQSLIEILIATGVGVLLIVAAVVVIAPALRSNTQAGKVQAGAALAKELMDSVTVWSGANWANLYSLPKGSSNLYYLQTTSSPFAVATGSEAVAVASTTYTRSFYAENVSRDSSGKIVASGGVNDPSTQKVTVLYSWPQSAARTMVSYLTRSRDNVIWQSDWSGGSGQEGPLTAANSSFASSSNIDTVNTGYIKINGIPVP
jgi:type II secretory pathway pseudopilin PulG